MCIVQLKKWLFQYFTERNESLLTFHFDNEMSAVFVLYE